MERHREESEELLKNMGANSAELDGKRRTRSSAVKPSPSAASPSVKKPSAMTTPTSTRRGRKKKADSDIEEERAADNSDTPKKSPPSKKQKLEDKLDAVDLVDGEADYKKRIDAKVVEKMEGNPENLEKLNKPEVVKETDVEMNNTAQTVKPVEVIEDKKEDKIEKVCAEKLI